MPSNTPSPTPEPPSALDASAVKRRRGVALAGHTGDPGTARQGLADLSAIVRATALGALARLGQLDDEDLREASRDPGAEVRRRACELSAVRPALGEMLVELLADEDPRVTEAACFALGELADAVPPSAVAAVATVTLSHSDPSCREAAVAALGAIGDRSGLEAILLATTDRPAVRRRAVLALAPFDGAPVDAALARALEDRDWQVRQAAEDLINP